MLFILAKFPHPTFFANGIVFLIYNNFNFMYIHINFNYIYTIIYIYTYINIYKLEFLTLKTLISKVTYMSNCELYQHSLNLQIY